MLTPQHLVPAVDVNMSDQAWRDQVAVLSTADLQAMVPLLAAAIDRMQRRARYVESLLDLDLRQHLQQLDLLQRQTITS